MTKDGGYLLPAVIDPPRISFCIEIPNEFNHILAFFGAMDDLTKWYNWQRDDAHTGTEVAKVWANIWDKAHQAYMNRSEEGCTDMTDPCCPETNDLLGQILTLLKGGATINFNTATQPSDFKVDCTPDDFSGNTDDTPLQALQWQRALCLALTNYAVAALVTQASNMNATNLIPQILALGGFTAPPDFTSQLVFQSQPFGIASINEILNSDNGFNEAICIIRDSLNDKPNTYASFKASMLEVFTSLQGNPDPALPNTASIIFYYGSDRVNYAVFSRALSKAHDDIVNGSPYECPCSSEECDPANFDIIAVNNCTVERIDDTHWHITQLNHTPVGDDKRQFVGEIRDANWRCINITNITQAESNYSIYDCDGTNHTGVGGSGGIVVQNAWANLEYNTDPIVGIDTIFTIECP